MLSPIIYGLSATSLLHVGAMRDYWTAIAQKHGAVPAVSAEENVLAHRQNVGYAFEAAIKAMLSSETCTVDELKHVLKEAPSTNVSHHGNYSVFLANHVTIENGSSVDVLRFLSSYGFQLSAPRILASAVAAERKTFLLELRRVWGVALPWKWHASQLLVHATTDDMRAWLLSHVCQVVGCSEDALYYASLVEEKRLSYHNNGDIADCIGLCDAHSYGRTPIALHREGGKTVLRPLALDLAECLQRKQEAEHKLYTATAMVEQVSKRHRVDLIL